MFGFIQRYLQANAVHKWAHMKAQSAVRFSDVTNNQMALITFKTSKAKSM